MRNNSSAFINVEGDEEGMEVAGGNNNLGFPIVENVVVFFIVDSNCSEKGHVW